MTPRLEEALKFLRNAETGPLNGAVRIVIDEVNMIEMARVALVKRVVALEQRMGVAEQRTAVYGTVSAG